MDLHSCASNVCAHRTTSSGGRVLCLDVLPSSVMIESIMFTITGPESYEKTGNIPVGPDRKTFSARIDGIPAAATYSLELNGTAADRGQCMGSAASDVARPRRRRRAVQRPW